MIGVPVPLPTAQTVAALPQNLRNQVSIESKPDGSAVITVAKPLSEPDENALVAALPVDQQEQARKQLVFQRHQAARLESPASRGEKFTVPALCLNVQGDLQLAEPDLFLDLGGWKLLDRKATLTPSEFKPVEGFESFEFDVDKDKVTYGHVSASVRQPELRGLDAEWDEKVLCRWLDRQCRQPDIGQTELLEFVRLTVADQLERKVPLGQLVFAKYRLTKAISAKISTYRNEAEKNAYQSVLFANNAPVEVSFDHAFSLPPDNYPAKWFYRGTYRFGKHYYGADRVGELENKGEEFECAQAIDRVAEIRFWVRNDLHGRPPTAFRLPLASGWFYPDFVAMLNDGRILVLEYKGAHLISDPLTKQKDNVGALWEAKSKGKGLFLMAERVKEGLSVSEQIRRKITPGN